MEPAEFTKMWSELRAEKTRLLNQRTEIETELSEINNKLAHLSETLTHLDPLTDNPHSSGEIAGLGITDAVRTILKTSSEKLSAKDVEQQLQNNGYDLSGLTAPMASIYKILNRLDLAGEVNREKEEGRVYYTWKFPPITDEDIPF
jgi:chromosome segregation ATPase